MCKVLGVPRSGYYAWKQHQPSKRQQEYERLIPIAHQASALMLCAARLRHIAGTKWGQKRYLNMDLLREQKLEHMMVFLRELPRIFTTLVQGGNVQCHNYPTATASKLP